MPKLKLVTVRDVTRFFWWLLILLPVDTAALCVRRRSVTNKMLILRVDALGDFVTWLDAAHGLRTLYPAHEITLLGNQSWRTLAEQVPDFDRVWSMDRKKFVTHPWYRYRLICQVRREGFSTILNPIWTRDFLWSDTLARASGSPTRICHDGDFSIIGPLLMQFINRWYTQVIFSRKEPRTELERNADFLRQLGASDFQASLPPLPLAPGRPDGFLAGDYYVLIPGAGKEYRQWPLENFAEIARRLHAQTQWTGIVVGAGQDRALGERLEAASGVPVQDWTGRTALKDLIRIIAGARLVIANETGGLHIAAALGVPAVCLIGGGHYGRYVPYRTEKPVVKPLPIAVIHPMPCFGCDWQCIYRIPPGLPKPCVSGITVDAVWDTIRQMPALAPEVISAVAQEMPAQGKLKSEEREIQ